MKRWLLLFCRKNLCFVFNNAIEKALLCFIIHELFAKNEFYFPLLHIFWLNQQSLSLICLIRFLLSCRSKSRNKRRPWLKMDWFSNDFCRLITFVISKMKRKKRFAFKVKREKKTFKQHAAISRLCSFFTTFFLFFLHFRSQFIWLSFRCAFPIIVVDFYHNFYFYVSFLFPLPTVSLLFGFYCFGISVFLLYLKIENK